MNLAVQKHGRRSLKIFGVFYNYSDLEYIICHRAVGRVGEITCPFLKMCVKLFFFFKSVTYFNFEKPLATTRSIISRAPAVIHTPTHTHTRTLADWQIGRLCWVMKCQLYNDS